MNWLLTVLILSVFASGGAFAADEAKGKTLSERWCATCHVVSKDQRKGSADVPTFAQISNTRTLAQIRGALVTSHTRMPDMALTRDEVDNLIVYMQTLAPPREPFKTDPEKDIPPKTHRG